VTSGYFVKLDQFEGPLDLLLHLINEHQLDIFDIDLYVLTYQYLEYLRLMEFKDLTDAAAFMGLASQLIEMKSKSLIPTEKHKGVNEEDVEEDPTKTLEYRLQQYDTFRKAASFFENAPQVGVDIQTNQEWRRLSPKYEHIQAPLKGDPTTLVILYEQMLSGLSERKPARVTAMTHKISVEEIIEKMRTFIDKASFALFQGLYGKMPARYNLVASILAMLQLVRDGEMNIHQETMLGPIWLYKKDLDVSEISLDVGETADEHIAKFSSEFVMSSEATN
jgi:segregation and condensation protein A